MVMLSIGLANLYRQTWDRYVELVLILGVFVGFIALIINLCLVGKCLLTKSTPKQIGTALAQLVYLIFATAALSIINGSTWLIAFKTEILIVIAFLLPVSVLRIKWIAKIS